MHTIILHVLFFIDDSFYVFVLCSELTLDQIPLTIPDYNSHRKSVGKVSKEMERSVHSQSGSEKANRSRSIVDTQS
jgi:hypothetical protein